MPVVERDQYFVGEHVNFDITLLRANGTVPSGGELAGTTATLTLLPPPQADGTARDDEDLTVTPSGNLYSSGYDTLYDGWHEWRFATTGTIKSAQQGRFRVLPINT